MGSVLKTYLLFSSQTPILLLASLRLASIVVSAVEVVVLHPSPPTRPPLRSNYMGQEAHLLPALEVMSMSRRTDPVGYRFTRRIITRSGTMEQSNSKQSQRQRVFNKQTTCHNS